MSRQQVPPPPPPPPGGRHSCSLCCAAGMDPETRRNMWRLIQRAKVCHGGRCACIIFLLLLRGGGGGRCRGGGLQRRGVVRCAHDRIHLCMPTCARLQVGRTIIMSSHSMDEVRRPCRCCCQGRPCVRDVGGGALHAHGHHGRRRAALPGHEHALEGMHAYPNAPPLPLMRIRMRHRCDLCNCECAPVQP